MKLSAPGKLFLTGEYAVLWGAPATIAAVSPRLQATLDRRPAGELQLRVPGATLRGRMEAGGMLWSGPLAPGRFAARALELALATRELKAGFALQFARSPRGERGQKLGLGSSSASAAIAAAAGLLVVQGGHEVDPDRVFPIAAQAHWEVQGGKGSNGDIAAACYGGVIRYVRYPVDRPVDERPPRPDVRRLEAGQVRLALVFSGKSAKTPSMVAAVEKALTQQEREAFVAESRAATDAFARALACGDAQAAIESLNASGDLLDALGKRAGVEVVTPKLAEIQKLGRAEGIAAKVSGAGGGDGALFAGFEPEPFARALARVREGGHKVLELALSDGVRVDPPAQKPA